MGIGQGVEVVGSDRSVKLASIKTVTFSENSAAGLDNSIKLWIENYGKEKTFVALQYSFDGTAYSALLIYTE